MPRVEEFFANGTWTCPAWVTSVLVECWGAGGGGSCADTDAGGGGGGGAYSAKQVTVTPTTGYGIVVGQGGDATLTTTGNAGGDSTFDTNVVVAKGGAGASARLGGQGGQAASGVGDTKFSGGDGGDGVALQIAAGGGGSSAGPSANGNAGGDGTGTSTHGTGGSAVTGGGQGGTEGTGVFQSGQFPGGGGSGHTANTVGNGAHGKVRVTYDDPAGETETFVEDDTWTCPAGVYNVLVECWGAGGGGARATNDTATTRHTPGGGGGAYSRKIVPVTPGNDYDIVIGLGGSGDANTGGTGGDTTFDATAVVAKGGGGSANASETAGAGGASASGTGDVKFSGGAGGGTNSPSGGGGGGGGGSSAGDAASGNTGSTPGAGGNGGAGGTAPTGGAAGGKGGGNSQTTGRDGFAGQFPGGGGGGTSNGSQSYYRRGGPGNQGMLRITYNYTRTTYLDPDGNVAGTQSGWSSGGHDYSIVNDGVRSPTTPSFTNDNRNTQFPPANATARWTMQTFTLPDGEVVTQIKFWAYISNDASSSSFDSPPRYRLRIFVGAVQKADSGTISYDENPLSGGGAGAWVSYTWTVTETLSQADIDDLRADVVLTSAEDPGENARSVALWALYFEVTSAPEEGIFGDGSETVTFGESAVASRSRQGTGSESVSFSESGEGGNLRNELSESLSFSEASTGVRAWDTDVQETLIFAEQALRVFTYAASESLSLLETPDAEYVLRCMEVLNALGEVASRQRNSEQEASETLSVAEGVFRQVAKVASESLAFTEVLTKLKFGSASELLSLTEAVLASAVKAVSEQLTFVELAERDGSIYEREVTEALSIVELAVQLFGSSSPCDEGYVPAAPPGIRDGILLTHPYVGPTLSVELPNPKFGNRTVVRRIVRVARTVGGRLRVARANWPTIEVLEFSFERMTRAKRDELLDFVEASLGDEVGLLDHEDRQWRGIVNSDAVKTSQVGPSDCEYEASFTFRGTVVP